MSEPKYIDAEPYKWPYNGNLTPENTCIIVIGKFVSDEARDHSAAAVRNTHGCRHKSFVGRMFQRVY
jgi:hypothetical protein